MFNGLKRMLVFRCSHCVEQIKDGFAAAVGDSPPSFLCFFTFGEQGMVDGKPAHCNLMVNVALFG